MRVTHVITRLIVGGAQENTVASVLGLRQKPGLEINLIAGPGLGPEGSLESRFSSVPACLTIIPELVRPVDPWRDWMAFRELTRTFRKHHPAIVHTHSGKAGILGRLAAYKAQVPVIIHTIHGPSFGQFQGPIANGLFKSAERFAGKFTTAFVVVAEAMKDQYLATGIGRPEQYVKIFSGFDLQPYLTAVNDIHLREIYGIAPSDIVVGKIARLFKLKGHDDLLAAAPELVRLIPSVKFLLVGDGAWRKRFENKVKILGLEKNFVFAGLVRPEAVAALTGIMDIVIHLSRREGLPRALPQAMAAGKPIIAYDCGGAREVCRNEETGFLLQPGGVTGLVARISQLAKNPELRKQIGLRGREFVLDRFTVERMVNDLYQLYLHLAGKHGVAVS